ncbi:sugar phosphate nucleotidyltransferase, partial [Helicobacter rodentium]
MKALILAAGFGSRLMPLTQDNPKCMVEYRGKKLIDYEINALRGAGVSEIAVVGGYLFEVLKSYMESQFSIKNLYQNKNYDKTNMVQTMLCAREFLESCVKEKQDLMISYADIVYSAEIVRALVESQEPLSIVVDKDWRTLWEKRFANPLLDAET